MQTFVPYSCIIESHQVLDNRRLVKQNLETSQLLDAILDLPTKTGKPRKGWLNHPALIMWKNNAKALTDYLEAGINESNHRGFKSDYCQERLVIYRKLTSMDNDDLPIWWGDQAVHSSHKLRLLQKGYEEKLKDQKNADSTIEWYKAFNWDEMRHPEFFNCEYKWAVNITEDSYELQEKLSKDALKIKQLLIEKYGVNPYFVL